TVAGLSAERADGGREPRYALADLAPVLAPVATDDGEAVRIDLQRAPQAMGDVHRVPPRTFFTVAGGLSAFFPDCLAASPSVRRIANSAAISCAGRAPPGWYQWPTQFSEPAMAKAESLMSQGLIEPSAMPLLM